MARAEETKSSETQNSKEARVAGPSESGSVGNQVMWILGPPKAQVKLPAVLGTGAGGLEGLISYKLANIFSLFLLSIP